MRVPLGFAPAPGEATTWVRERLAWEAPALPGLAPGTVRRWESTPTWQPPETVVLCRHRSLSGPHWVVTNRRDPPDGYVLEYDLGLLQRHQQPGTRRLVLRRDDFALDDGGAEATVLGHVEQAAFPMMDVLELRRARATGQPVLVSGAEDQLVAVTDPVAVLGFVEAFPIQPKRVADTHVHPRHLAPLERTSDRESWRHVYARGTWDEAGDRDPSTLRLGTLWTLPLPDTVALVRGADGQVATELLPAPARSAAELVRNAPHWVAAPLGWERRPQAWAVRATGSRLRHAARGARPAAPSPPETLGHLRAGPAPGHSPLYRAHHPVLGDQFLTRSPLEATDLGYRIDGILGHIADLGADRQRGPDEILWGSRFGRARRYTEE